MLESAQRKKFLFVINPISGDIDKEDLAARIEDYANKFSWEIKLLYTTGQDDDRQIAETIESSSPETVVAVGGDGTVNMVARHVVNTDMILGIIPMGSGNGLSKDLNIPQNDIDQIFEMFNAFNVIPIDTLTANSHFFFHLADIGFNAHIVKLFSKGKSRGLLSYIKYTLKEFYNYKTSRYSIKTDNGSFSGKAFMITIANSNQFGSNLTINPNGKYDDGIFEVIIIKRFPRIQSFRIFFQLIFKRINFSPYCVILKCKEAEIESKTEKTIQYDGELGQKYKKVHIKINPRSIKVLVPPSK